MGTSTVSGPFRSQNGFQELVNGQWVPVGGGGGGNSAFTTIYRTETNLVYTLPAPTEVGQIYNIFVPMNANTGPFPTGELVIVPTPFAGDSSSRMTGNIMVYTTDSLLYVTGETSSSDNAVRLFDNTDDVRASLQIVYVASAGGITFFEAMGSCLHFGGNPSNPRIIYFAP